MVAVPVVPVFVSSTFRDFHAERDVIAQVVTPALDEVLAPYGARVQLSDLRWGVDTSSPDAAVGALDEDAREAAVQGKVLGICLREIEQSRPLFVGLLGDRYGWVPQDRRVRDVVAAAQAMRASRIEGVAPADSGGGPDAAAALDLPDDLPPGAALSITALEFWSGALAMSGDVVIGRRQLAGEPPTSWTETVPEKIAGRRWLADKVEHAATARPDQIRLFDYQLRVASTTDAQGRTRVSADAADLEAFAQDLIEQLTPMVEQRARELGATATSGYAAAASLLAEQRGQVVAGRDRLLDEVVTALADKGPGVVLHGPSGIGKTTATLAVAGRLADEGWTVATVLVGAGPGSTSTSDVIGLLAEQLGVKVPRVPLDVPRLAGRDRIGVAVSDESDGVDRAVGGEGVEGGSATPTVPLTGEPLLAWWAQVLAEASPRSLVVIDALDRLDAGDARDDIEVLRSVTSGGAKVLTSTTLPEHVRALTARGLRDIKVGELDPAGVETAARGWAAASGARELPASVLDVMAQRPRSGLWVRLAVQQLTWLEQEDFAQAEDDEVTDDAAALVALLTGEVSAMPDDDSGLAAQVLDQTAERIGDRQQAQRFFSALAVTRSGLAMADLQGLSGASEVELKSARWRLGGQIVERDAAGRLAFDHQVMKTAALRLATGSRGGEVADGVADRSLASANRRVAEYLGSPGGGAADVATGDSLDLVAVADRVWHGLLSGDSTLTVGALERAWDSPLKLEQVAEVIAGAVTQGRTAGDVVVAAVSGTPEVGDASVGSVRQLQKTVVESGRHVLTVGETKALSDATLAIARELVQRNPDSADARRDVSVSLDNVGQVALAGGDLPAARRAYTDSLELRRELAQRNPDSADARRDVMVSLVRLAELAEQQHGESSPQVRQAWADVVTVLDQMDAYGWITPADRGFAEQFRAKAAASEGQMRAAGTQPPRDGSGDAAATTPTDAPGGFTGTDRIGGPTPSAESAEDDPDIAALVAAWLATDTWDASFAFLRDHQIALATRAGRDQVEAQTGPDDPMGGIHLEILDMAAGGVPLESIARLVTDIDAATTVCVTGLANGQPQIAVTIMGVSHALMQSARGLAVQVAILAHLSPDNARNLCRQLATAEPDIAAAVADEFDTLAAQIAAAGAPVPDADTYSGLLRPQEL